MIPALRSASTAICLPGMPSKREARRHLGDSRGALGDDDELYDHNNSEDNDGDGQRTARDKTAERRESQLAGVAFGEDESRRGRVQHQGETASNPKATMTEMRKTRADRSMYMTVTQHDARKRDVRSAAAGSSATSAAG